MLKDFLGNISNGVKKHKNEIILGIIVFLLVLLSFSVGYIAANYQETKPIKFEETANSKQQTANSKQFVLCFLFFVF